MSTVTINGKTYSGLSGGIVIAGNCVYAGGKLVDGEAQGVVEVIVEGDLTSLESSASVTVNGNVQGDVDAGGSINCGNVGGSVKAGGSANCANVAGSVKAGGSVNHR